MTIKAFVAAAAFTAATALALPVFAQDAMAEKTINGIVVPEAQQGLILQHCESLAAFENPTDSQLQDSDVATLNNDNSTDSRSTGNANLSEMGAATASLQFDLDTVSVATCREGGWID
jgi:hypothetical protein